MDALRLDLAYALRRLRRDARFALAVTLTLAISGGAAVAIFAVVYGVLLKPLLIRDQGRVVVLRKEQLSGSDTLFPFAVMELDAYAEQTRVLDAVAGAQYDGAGTLIVRDRDRRFPVTSAMVSGNFFEVLGMRPVIGRALNAEDDVVGGERVAVISQSLWRRQFGSDPGVVGRTFRTVGLGAVESGFTLVGVMPRGLEFPGKAEMWVPTLTVFPQAAMNRLAAPYSLVGRLRRGATVEQARAELSAFLAHQKYQPGEPRDVRANARPIQSVIVGDIRPALLLLAAGVALLMTLATANLGNLFLVRGFERRREFAVRAAMGAGGMRFVRLLLVEGLVLALVGGAGGVLLAWWLVRGLVALAPAELPRLDAIGVDPAVVAVALLMSTLSSVAFSVPPAMVFARSDLSKQLRIGGFGGSTDPAARRGGSVLAVAQVAMALVVLVGAGLLIRTLGRLQSLDMGFTADELGTANLSFAADYPYDRPRLQSLYDRVIARVGSLPGISSATMLLLPPFTGLSGWDASYTLEGQSALAAAANPSLDFQPILPGYFRTMGISIRRGRAIGSDDRMGASPVAVVDESLARRAWPGLDPLGRRIKFGTLDSSRPWHTVVGVAGNVRYRELTSPRPAVYVAWAQTDLPPLSFLVTRGPAARSLALSELGRIVSDVEPTASATDASSMRQRIVLSLTRPRFNAVVLGAVALIALTIAGIGIYAVMAALVRQRSREIGIRIALGAQPENVRRLVLGRGLALAVMGVVIGLAVTVPAAHLLGAVLYGVSPADPLTMMAASAILIALAGLAGYLPARTATRLDPLVVLRSE